MLNHSTHRHTLLATLRQISKPAVRPVPRGQAMVEFAFSFSILALMFFGLMLAALALFSFLTANSAARDAAHLIITDPTTITDQQVTDQICNSGVGLGGTTAACKSSIYVEPSTVDYACPPPSPPSNRNPLVWIQPGEADKSSRQAGSSVTVSICYLTPIPSLSLPSLNGGRLYIFGPAWVAGRTVMGIPY